MEMEAIDVAVRRWAHKGRAVHLISDSVVTLTALAKGLSANFEVNTQAVSLIIWMRQAMVQPVLWYINTKHNPADPLTRSFQFYKFHQTHIYTMAAFSSDLSLHRGVVREPSHTIMHLPIPPSHTIIDLPITSYTFPYHHRPSHTIIHLPIPSYTFPSHQTPSHTIIHLPILSYTFPYHHTSRIWFLSLSFPSAFRVMKPKIKKLSINLNPRNPIVMYFSKLCVIKLWDSPVNALDLFCQYFL